VLTLLPRLLIRGSLPRGCFETEASAQSVAGAPTGHVFFMATAKSWARRRVEIEVVALRGQDARASAMKAGRRRSPVSQRNGAWGL